MPVSPWQDSKSYWMRAKVFVIRLYIELLGAGARSVGGKLGPKELHVEAAPSLVGLTPRVFTRPDTSS